MKDTLAGFTRTEKGLILSLLLTVFLFGGYFLDVFSSLLAGPDAEVAGFQGLLGIIILFVVLEIIIYSLLGTIDKDDEDERGRLIEKLSYRNAYWCLVVGVWFIIAQTLIAGTLNNPAHWFNETLNFLSPYFLGNLLLFFFIVAEISACITQINYYQRGF